MGIYAFDEISTMNEKLICPYCGEEQYTHEPDDISADMCLTECEHCGRKFWYSVLVIRNYWPRKDDEEDTEHE